jgi:aldehyde:ferredoxin oxidoreductase
MGRILRVNQMLSEYYDLRGWDEFGRPKDRKLKEIGLMDEVG